MSFEIAKIEQWGEVIGRYEFKEEWDKSLAEWNNNAIANLRKLVDDYDADYNLEPEEETQANNDIDESQLGDLQYRISQR